jgi:fimbrial chaperone protein
MDQSLPSRAASCSPVVFLLAGLLLAMQASAGGVSVSPTRVELSADQRIAALTLTNDSSRPYTLQMEASRWFQANGRDDHEPTDELLATPPIFTLEPGESQVVRVGLRRSPDANQELSYRLFAQEIPEPTPEGFSGLHLVLRLSMPVFVAPARPATEPVLSWHVESGTSGDLEVSATNDGNRRAYLTRVRFSADGLSIEPGNLRYVLPGASGHWRFDIDRAISPGTELELTGLINGEPFSARVPVH